MSSWRECKLGDVIDVKHGYAFKGENITTEKTSDILVTPGNFNIGGGFKSSKFKYFNGNYPEDYIFSEGDIVVTMTDLSKEGDTLGYSAKIPKCEDCKYLHNQRVGLIKFISNDVYKDFIYWLMRTREYQSFIVGAATGTSIRHTSPKLIKEYAFELPPLEEQKAIAEILSSLDDKIDLLHRQNKTLESLAQTLFRQWFIEEAKEEWEDISLDKCCIKITKGTTPTTLKKQFVESGINFIKVNCIDEKGGFLKDKFDFIDDETNELLNRSKLEKGDILYSIAGTIGRLAMVNDEILPANVNQALAILRIDKSVINPYFVKYCLLDKDITFELHSKIVHAVQPNLSLGEISNTLIPYPPKEILDSFSNQIEPIEEKINQNKQQIQTLENLRDTLLPKLLSGEVRVRCI